MKEKSIKTEWQLQKSQTAIGSLAKGKNTTAKKEKTFPTFQFFHLNDLLCYIVYTKEIFPCKTCQKSLL